ncbi:MAG: hypothetical protein SNG35_07170 [Rikenellaceae bacterium]
MKRLTRSLITLLALMTLTPSVAQYYSWGADDVRLGWSKIKQDSVSVVYPTSIDPLARRILHYINAVHGDIYTGYDYPPLNLPFVLHPQNFSSNALVMWMPKRIDFLTTPATENFSMLWTKQLVAHEYRHAVQYNTLSKGIIKPFRFLLGQQGAMIGFLYLPLFAIEGDAVWMETQMSSFGRGVQPSMTMHYRAVGREAFEREKLDRWMCGSYREYIPDHYSLGYQVVSYSYTRYDEHVWSRVANYGVRTLIDPWCTSHALERSYGVNKVGLIRDAFDNLYTHFESLPARENSMEIVSTIDTTNYTTYAYPQIVEGGDVIALKSDYNRTRRIVKFDTETNEEQRLSYVGNLSTPLNYQDGRVWWSEYRYSKLFDQRVGSKICYLDIDDGRPKSIKGIDNALYPTPMGDRVSYVEYDYRGFYSIVLCEVNERELKELNRLKLPSPTEVHGLAWDSSTNGLYFIATDDSGMWIGEADLDRGEYRQLRDGAYITISNLRAGNGSLYFSSIESGYDEIHRIDLATGNEYRISESEFGSFSPSAAQDSTLYATTYDRYGYHLSRLKEQDLERVEPANLPKNIVNPETTKWDVVNLDTVSFTPADSMESQRVNRKRKYNKGLKLIDIHSWYPFSFSPYNFNYEKVLEITWGTTLLTQNLLSNTDGYFTYGYSASEGSTVEGTLNSNILGLDLAISGIYGGDQLNYLNGSAFILDGTSGYLYRDEPFDKKYYSVGSSLSLPLLFDGGYHLRRVTPWVSWSYNNGMVTDFERITIDPNSGEKAVAVKEGVHAMTFGASYSGWVRSAQRDYLAPFSYSLLAAYTLSPNDRYFKDLISLYGSITTRTFIPQSYITLAANYQNSVGGERIEGMEGSLFQSVRLLPTGFSSSEIINNKYLAGSFTLYTPIWSPEGGIDGFIYLKRIRIDASYSAARFNDFYNNSYFIDSYGGGITLDMNLFRMPDACTVGVRFGLYKPSGRGPAYQFGVDMPF